MRTFFVALVVAAAVGGGCTFVEVDADIQSLCSTRHDLDVRGAPPGLRIVGEVDLATDVELESSELEALRDLDADVRFAHVRLRPTSGVANLDFIQRARVTLASGDPDSILPTVTVVDCAGDCPRDGIDLLFPSDADANALDYASSGTLVIGTTIGGELPTVDWTMDIEICTTGTASASGSL